MELPSLVILMLRLLPYTLAPLSRHVIPSPSLIPSQEIPDDFLESEHNELMFSGTPQPLPIIVTSIVAE